MYLTHLYRCLYHWSYSWPWRSMAPVESLGFPRMWQCHYRDRYLLAHPLCPLRRVCIKLGLVTLKFKWSVELFVLPGHVCLHCKETRSQWHFVLSESINSYQYLLSYSFTNTLLGTIWAALGWQGALVKIQWPPNRPSAMTAYVSNRQRIGQHS